MRDRRASLRIVIDDLPCTLFSNTGNELEAEVKNISETGVLLSLGNFPDKLPEQLKIQFCDEYRDINGEKKSVVLSADIKVVRAEKVDGDLEIGCKFIGFDGNTRNYLTERISIDYINKLKRH